MSNLEDLVPPLELCRKIPPGEFKDTALIWFFDGHSWWVNAPEFDAQPEKEYPAPTLQEILAELDTEGLCCPSARFDSDTWTVYWIDNPVNEIWCAHESDKNPATAALKLWLEVNKSVKSKIKSKIKSKEETEKTEVKHG